MKVIGDAYKNVWEFYMLKPPFSTHDMQILTRQNFGDWT
jgi:hypothetical protein